MDWQASEEERMRQYLLGELSEKEQTRIEERFFTDDEFFERLSVMEDKLIEEFVRDELNENERERFESGFLASPRLREKVEFTRALIETVNEKPASSAPEIETSAESPVEEPAKSLLTHPETSFPRSFLRAFRQTPASELLKAAVMLIVLGVGLWLILNMMQQRSQLTQRLDEQQGRIDQLRTENQTLQQRAQAAQQAVRDSQQAAQQAQQQLAEEREQARGLDEQFAQLKQELQQIIFSDTLVANVRGGPDAQKTLVIPRGAQLVKIELEFAGTLSASYRVVLRKEGEDILRQSNLQAREVEPVNVVDLILAASVFTTGKYEISLFETGVEIPAGIYDFGVEKR